MAHLVAHPATCLDTLKAQSMRGQLKPTAVMPSDLHVMKTPTVFYRTQWSSSQAGDRRRVETVPLYPWSVNRGS